MIAPLAVAFVVGVALAVAAVLAAEPTDPGAVTAFLFGLGTAVFAVASAALYYVPPRLRRSRRKRAALPALRRGAILGIAVATLAYLRALDALTPLTAVFVLAALAALEGIVAARG